MQVWGEGVQKIGLPSLDRFMAFTDYDPELTTLGSQVIQPKCR